MRVSEYFQLNRTQPFLDFVDVPLNTDIEVFVSPAALNSLQSNWGHECRSLIQHYFEVILKEIKAGNHEKSRNLMSCLKERNEFHLGYSVGKSQGSAFGSKSAESVWGALAKSRASMSGLLQDLEDTCLLIDGIGRDMVSDAACNILRGPLIKYTQHMCTYYGIPLTPGVDSGPIWDPRREQWGSHLVPLPMTDEGKVIFVPKVFVRHRLMYQYNDYYNHYLLPEMQEEEKRQNTALVELLKNGKKRVTKKALKQKYGENKLAVVEQTLRHPNILEAYKRDKDAHPSYPLDHDELAEIEQSPPPDWSGLIDELGNVPSGQASARQYEDTIEKILTVCFYPSLCNPQKQSRIHKGRKIIDIRYTNEARHGFFHWLATHYPAGLIFVECKNYGKEVGNPEVDQLAGRFSPSRGRVGILICRGIENHDRLRARCRDTARDDRGFIIVLDDSMVEEMVSECGNNAAYPHRYSVLRREFEKLIT